MNLLKKLTLAILFVGSITLVEAGNSDNLSAERAARAVQLQERVEEIKNLDFKTYSKDDRKALKSELKDIKKELKSVQGGLDSKFSISIGAAIIIILLLILLL